MADIKLSDKEPIDFKYNLRVYFGFLKKYKWISFFLVLLVFGLSTLDLAFNYIFKLIVDKATQFTQGKLALADLERFLWAAFACLLAIPVVRGFGRWIYLGSINSLESRLI